MKRALSPDDATASTLTSISSATTAPLPAHFTSRSSSGASDRSYRSGDAHERKRMRLDIDPAKTPLEAPPPQPALHTPYPTDMADVALVSCEGIEMRVSSVVLIATCGLFADAHAYNQLSLSRSRSAVGVQTSGGPAQIYTPPSTPIDPLHPANCTSLMRSPSPSPSSSSAPSPSPSQVSELPSPTVTSTPIPPGRMTSITLDFPTTTIIHLLDALHGRPFPPNLLLADLHALLDLSLFLQCAVLPSLIAANALALVRSHPWDTFVLASRLEHLALAQLCLDNKPFDQTYLARLNRGGPTMGMVQGMPTRYVAELRRAMAMFPVRQRTAMERRRGVADDRWHNISKMFRPQESV